MLGRRFIERVTNSWNRFVHNTGNWFLSVARFKRYISIYFKDKGPEGL